MGNWDNGGKRALKAGDEKLLCEELRSGQLYAVMMYNSAQNDREARVTVFAHGKDVEVRVPGTTGNEGLASVCLVSGEEGNSVSVSIARTEEGAEIQVWLFSVSMPTQMPHDRNIHLQPDGKEISFGTYTRAFCVPPSTTSRAVLRTAGNNQFIALQMREDHATVLVLNPSDTYKDRIKAIGRAAAAYTTVTATERRQEITSKVQGDGTQIVWMNADSEQDSTNVKLSLQALGR